MTEDRKSSVVINRWVLISLMLIIFVLASLTSIFYGQVISYEKWAAAVTAAQLTSQLPTPTQQAPSPIAALDLNTIKGVFDKNVVKFGDKTRKALVVEVSDPSCPYCHVADGIDPELASQIGAQFIYVSAGGTYQPPLTEIRKLVDSGEASYAFVYYPGHSNGEMAAKALYCAFDQGKFWQAHDLLYSYQGYNLINKTVQNDKANSGPLADFLSDVVDATALKACLDSGKYDTRITDETALAESTLLDQQEGGGTPTFIINTTRFNGAYSWAEMKAVVDAAIK